MCILFYAIVLCSKSHSHIQVTHIHHTHPWVHGKKRNKETFTDQNKQYKSYKQQQYKESKVITRTIYTNKQTKSYTMSTEQNPTTPADTATATTPTPTAVDKPTTFPKKNKGVRMYPCSNQTTLRLANLESTSAFWVLTKLKARTLSAHDWHAW